MRSFRSLTTHLLLLVAPVLMAQQYPVTATLQVLPPYSPSLAAFADPSPGNRPNGIQLTLTFNDFNEPSYPVKLRITLEGPGVTLRTNAHAIPSVVTLTPGLPITLDNASLAPYFDVATMDVLGIDLQTLFANGGRLPEGNYLMYAEALDLQRNVVVSNTAFFPIYAELLDPPEIITPTGLQPVTSPQFLNFTWWNKHIGSFPVRYTLAIYDTIPGLPDAQVVQMTTPYFSTQVTDLTQYTYQPYDPPLQPGHTYLIQVRVEDLTGQLTFKRNGFSEVARFRWGEDVLKPSACLPPAQLEASRSDSSIHLTWVPPADSSAITFYDVHWRIDQGPWSVERTHTIGYQLPGISPASIVELFISRTCGGDEPDGQTDVIVLEADPNLCLPPLLTGATRQQNGAYDLAWEGQGVSYEISLLDTAGRPVEVFTTADRYFSLNGLDSTLNHSGRIVAICRDSSYSDPTPFYINNTGSLPKIVYDCGVAVQPLLNDNDTPIPLLQPGDTVIAGDFKVKLLEVTGGQGHFSGSGVMIWNFPLRNFLNPAEDPIAVNIDFDNIKVNTDFLMYDGFMNVSGAGVHLIPPNLASFLREFNQLEFINDALEQPAEWVQVDFTIEEASFSEGQITISGTDDQGNQVTTTVPWSGDDTEITGADGKVYVVDADGLLKEAGILAPGGAPHATNTLGVDEQGRPAKLTSLGVTFHAGEGKYAFDVVSPQAHSNELALYPAIPVDDDTDPYLVPFKAIINNKTDVITAILSDEGPNPDSIIFKTQSGRLVETTWTGRRATLSLQGLFRDARETVYATHILHSGQQVLIGTFELMHLPGMDLHVSLVPTSDASIPQDITTTLQGIYSTVGVNLTVQALPSINLPLDLLGEDGRIATEGSATFANYSPKLQDINRHLFQSLGDDYRHDTYYLIFTDVASSTGLAGFMPLQRQYGYLFDGGNEETKSSSSLVAAHELGHGIFGLRHPFSQFNIPQNATDWLMDYANGDQLPYLHWDHIYNPDFQLYLFQGDQEGERIVPEEAFLYTNYIYFSNSENPGQFASITPSGHRYILPADAVAAYYPDDDDRWPQGSLAGFNVGTDVFYGWWDKTQRRFLGYAQGTMDQHRNLNKSGDFLPSLPILDQYIYAGISGQGCQQKILHHGPQHSSSPFSDRQPIANQLDLEGFQVFQQADVPQTNCGCYQGPCSELLQTYKNHPFLTSDNILKRVICANPCVLSHLTSLPSTNYPPSEWMENLNNICAGLLAFGFTPAALAGLGISMEGLMVPIIQGIIAQTPARLALRFSIGSTLDLLIQTACHYYFPDPEEAISWNEAKNRIDPVTGAISGAEAIIMLESRYAETAISAAISCFVDGNLQNGKVKDGFDLTACAQGALSALLFQGALEVSPFLLKRLKALPPAVVIRGLLKLSADLPPGVHAAGFNPDGSTIWRMLKTIFPERLTTNHVKALFKIQDEQLAQRLAQTLEDATARADFLDRGLFLKIHNLDLPLNVREDLVMDLQLSGELRDLMVTRDGVVEAWRGLFNSFTWVRTNTDLIEKMIGRSTDYINKVNDLYSPSIMKLPPTLKSPHSPPGKYNNITYDKFGFPRLEPHISHKIHVVKIMMDGSNDDYIRAYNKIKGIVGEGNIQFTNQYGSSFRIKQDGQWSEPYTWHHHQDGESMMPVLQTVHQSIQNYHTGGRAIVSRQLKGLFDPPQI